MSGLIASSSVSGKLVTDLAVTGEDLSVFAEVHGYCETVITPPGDDS